MKKYAPPFTLLSRRHLKWIVAVSLIHAAATQAAVRFIDFTRVVNVIPNSQSAEAQRNDEPSIAVGPTGSPRPLIIGTFDSANPRPYFTSIDGGLTWSNPFNLAHGDTTLEWSPGGVSYLARLNAGVSEVQRSTDPIGAGYTLISGSGIGAVQGDTDQPWLAVSTVAGVDRVYMGFNDLRQINRTASVRFSLNGGATWNTRIIEKVTPGFGQDGPPVRVAPSKSGDTVYAMFTRWDAPTGDDDIMGDVVVVRSDDGGLDGFSALGPNGRGVNVAENVSLPNLGHLLGNQKIRSAISIAVSPNDANKVYVAFTQLLLAPSGEMVQPRLKVRRSTDAGLTWSDVLTSVIPSDQPSSLPALAVADDDAVGLLFTTLASGSLTTKFVRSTLSSGLGSTVTKTLSQFPNGDPPPSPPSNNGTPRNYVGDYEDLEAVGNAFYGTFSASNDPDPDHFPSGVRFQRFVKVGASVLDNFDLTSAGTLVASAAGTTPVDKSIDPYYFSYSRFTLPIFGKITFITPKRVRLTWPDCGTIDCCPGCPGPEPLIYPEVAFGLAPQPNWQPLTNSIIHTNGEFQMIVDTSLMPNAFFRLGVMHPTNATVQVTAAAGAHGSITPSGTNVIPAGQTVRFTATPSANYAVNKWFLNGELVQTNGTNFDLAAIESDARVTASFAPVDDLSIDKNVPTVRIPAGRPFTYTLNVVNSGIRTANAIVVTDTLPPGLTFLSAAATQGSCVQTAGVVTCTLGSLSRSAEARIAVRVSAGSVGWYTNTASVVGSASEIETNNNRSTAIAMVEQAPTITQQPISRAVAAGQSVTFTVTATGTATLEYRWYHNDEYLPGETGPALTITSAQASHAGTYRVQVRNDTGRIFSNLATLTVQ